MSIQGEIRLREDGTWTVTDITCGVSAEGESRTAALDTLDDLIAESRDESKSPLGDRLKGMAGDLDVDGIKEVRDSRGQT